MTGFKEVRNSPQKNGSLIKNITSKKNIGQPIINIKHLDNSSIRTGGF